LGLVGCFIPVVQYFTGFLALLAIILGAVGRGKAARIGASSGMATAGLVLGIIGSIGTIIAVAACTACAAAIGSLI
jgi:hypothetical protein